MIQRQKRVRRKCVFSGAFCGELPVDERVPPRVDRQEDEASIPVTAGKLFVDRSERCRGVRSQGKISRERGKSFHGHPMQRVCLLNRDLSMVCVVKAAGILAAVRCLT